MDLICTKLVIKGDQYKASDHSKKIQQVKNCQFYEKVAEEFSEELIAMITSDEVFCEFVSCEFKRQS